MNLQEEKACFMAMHYLQSVFSYPNQIVEPEFLTGGLVDMVRCGQFDEAYLLLRTVEQLSDEETKTLRNIISIPDSYELVLRKKGDFIVYKPSGEYYPTYAETGLKCYDYLRSRGILIPWREYSTEQILERGWVKTVKEV